MPKDILYTQIRAMQIDKKTKTRYLKYLTQYEQVDIREGEEWRSIEVAPNYSVSNFGRIKHNVTNTVRITGMNSQRQNIYSYIAVGLNGKVYRLAVIVATAFCKKLPAFVKLGIPLFVDHINGDTKNNRADNLQWVTSSINNRLSRMRKNGENTRLDIE